MSKEARGKCSELNVTEFWEVASHLVIPVK